MSIACINQLLYYQWPVDILLYCPLELKILLAEIFAANETFINITFFRFLIILWIEGKMHTIWLKYLLAIFSLIDMPIKLSLQPYENILQPMQILPTKKQSIFSQLFQWLYCLWLDECICTISHNVSDIFLENSNWNQR